MFGRSASGPGGLSINTGGANLFGSGTTQQTPAAGGGLFGSTTTTQPAQQGTSLFGGTSTATTQPQQPTGSLFGTTATSQPQQSGGLLGQTTTTPQAQTGGLFGNKLGTTQPAQPQQQQQTGGLFGGGTATTAQQPQTMSLFGGATTQQTQPQQSGGLFGATPQQPQQQQGGLFGGTSTTTGTSMFGTKPDAPAATSLFGGGSLGQSTMQQPAQQQVPGLTMGQTAKQSVVPGVRIDLSNIRSTTRFNDLQETLQKEIADIDDRIQKCIRDYEAVEAFLPSHGELLSAIPTDVSFVSRKSEGAHRALESDIDAINQLHELIKTDADNARLSFKAIDNLKLPVQYHQTGLWSKGGSTGAGDANAESNSDLITFFSKTADEMDTMMNRFEKNLGEIEVHLHGVQGNMMEALQRAAAGNRPGQNGVDENVLELAAVLREFEEGILKVAGKVGGLKEGITELQLKDFMGHGS
ncbi:Nucleoporin nup49/NSP49 (Nuclear pore protein nup49/NSP49) [Podospora pseudocomata]|uniref:Nucleoporin nup49/NSP49 (Nuclear pore protein nup49/NSP49) n=1 Tax=Podospora pseudocomata TaxID=2093779 RepID=A0ABR0GIC8_9PEZI|nr:Nucleoporin nup49/NSP49 (Nuclear pore protein nup49/NSP49) [Podospora pseudocomata]